MPANPVTEYRPPSPQVRLPEEKSERGHSAAFASASSPRGAPFTSSPSAAFANGVGSVFDKSSSASEGDRERTERTVLTGHDAEAGLPGERANNARSTTPEVPRSSLRALEERRPVNLLHPS